MDVKEELMLSIYDNDSLTKAMERDHVIDMASAAADLILCPTDISAEDMKVMEDRILDIYKNAVKSFHYDDIVSFSTIFEEVSSHNDEIFDTLAEIEYRHGPQHYEEEYIRSYLDEGYDEDQIPGDEVLGCLVDEWQQYYYDSYMGTFESLDEFVAFVLNKYRCAYSFEKYDIPYDNTNAGNILIRTQGATFINNDAQNAINPELMNFGFAGYSDFLNYHEELDVIKGIHLLTAGKKK